MVGWVQEKTVGYLESRNKELTNKLTRHETLVAERNALEQQVGN